MKSMKISHEDKTASTDEVLYAQQGPEYPSGLKLYLDETVLKKLDLPKLPQVGEMFLLHASVEVVEVGIDRASNGGRDKRLCLQITELELQDREKESDETAETGYEKTILGG